MPPWLREMLNYKLRDSRLGIGKLNPHTLTPSHPHTITPSPVAELPSSPLTRPASPVVVQNSELMYTESWHIHTACVHLSFTKTDKHEVHYIQCTYIYTCTVCIQYVTNLWVKRATGGSNIASEVSYWCNRRETSEIQATRGSEALYAHARYNTQPVGIVLGTCCSMHGVMPAYEFRRGFCTLVLSCSICARTHAHRTH